MSRVLQPTNPTQAPVLPGTQVITQIPMATAVNAGDYVYLNATGYGVATSNPQFGPLTIPWNGLTTTGYIQSGGSLPPTQYGPVNSQTTYSGSTYTVGQVALTPTTLNSLDNSSYGTGVTALTNGNFVYIYRTAASTYSFKILDQTGATIAGPTVIASNISDSTARKIAITPLASGGFIIFYCQTTGTGLYVRKYTSAGVLSGSTFNLPAGGSSSTGYSNLSIIETSNQNLGFYYVVTASTAGYYTITDGSFNIVKAHGLVDQSGSNYGNAIQYFLAAIPLASGNIAAVWWDNTYSLRIGFYSPTGAWLNSSSPLSPSNSISASYAGSICICPTGTGDQFFVVGQTGSQFTSYRLTPTSSYNGFSFTSSSNIDVNASANGYYTNIFACSADTYGVFYVRNNSQPYVCFTTSSTQSSTTWGTPIALNGTTVGYAYNTSNCFIASPNGRAGWLINPDALYYPSALNVAWYAVTNGQTLVGSPYAPPNYYLQGVSLNTVSSGQTANVVINGSATLNSNYPSLTSTTAFDYSGTGQFGNYGSVFGRTVTLKGAQ